MFTQTTGFGRITGLAALSLTMCAGLAQAQSVNLTFESNTVGALIGQATPGGVWAYPSGGDRAGIWNVVNGGSPAGGGTKSIQFTGGGNIRIAADFGQNFDAGLVRFQFDMKAPTGAATRMRLMLHNLAIPADTTTAQATDNFMSQHYFDAGGGQFSPGIWGSNAPTFGAAVFNDAITTRSNAPSICADKWYRVAYYYDFDAVGVPMRRMEISDISSGTPVLVAQRDYADGVGMGVNNTGAPANNPKFFRSMVIRMTDSAAGAYQLDNIRLDGVASIPGTLLSLNDPGDPAPIAKPSDPSPADVTVAEAVDLGGTVGLMPSLVHTGSTFYTMDDQNGLLSWDGISSSVNFVDAALPIIFNSNTQGTMTPSADGSKLYVVSVTSGLGSTTTASWRDLAAYNIAGGTWGLTVDSGLWNPTGDGHIGRAVVNGRELVYTGWQGAAQYTAFNATAGTSAVAVGGVGNRWTGAATEGRTADEVILLAQTDADGNRLNNSPMPLGGLNSLYRTTYVAGCVNDNPVLRRISPSAKTVPWSANDPSADGPGTGRQAMTLACGDQVWLTRGSGTNQIGVYSITQDKWQVLNVFEIDGVTPLNMTRSDISTDGDFVYFITEGKSKVFRLGCVDFGGGNNCPADFNGDTFVDDTDFVTFAACYEEFIATGPCTVADFNNDGFVDDTDFVTFAAAYENFVCP